MSNGDKSQGIRLLDVFVIGPFLVWAGGTKSDLPEIAKRLLIGTGLATIGYNGVNYVRKLKESEDDV